MQEDEKNMRLREYLAQCDLYLTKLQFGEQPYYLGALAKKIRTKHRSLTARGVDIADLREYLAQKGQVLPENIKI